MEPSRSRAPWRLSRAWLSLGVAAVGMAEGEPLKGMAYGPFPSKIMGAAIHLDDFMSDAAKPLWGPRGRADLATIQALGANAVRLYGNDPKLGHREFLDEAHSVGLRVIPGMSDFAYIQMPGNCQQTNYDCYSQIKDQYLENLRNGFLVENGNYHPALLHVIAINEPDLKLPGMSSPTTFCRGIISAIDGMLDAEKEAGATGTLIPLTATFSFGLCGTCKKPSSGNPQGYPGLDQMLELREAFLHPQAYGYKPKNDLSKFYWKRWMNSFNTANPATELNKLFFDQYRVEFPTVMVAIEEFHSIRPPINQETDLKLLQQMVAGMSTFVGANFFEYQVRYDKGGEEMGFGMLGLGDYAIDEMEFFGEVYPVWCLTGVRNEATGRFVSAEVAAAYGGRDVDFATSCRPDASKVHLDAAGFESIKGLGQSALATFAVRLVQHLGGEADSGRAWGFAGGLPRMGFDGAVAALRQHPSWAAWPSDAGCVANRLSNLAQVGKAVEDLCQSNGFWFKCQVMQEDSFPAECRSGWRAADYVLSVYFNQIGGNPLQNCYDKGAAIYAPPSYYRSYDTRCVVTKDPATTPLTDEGFQAVVAQNNKDFNTVFFRRVVTEKLGAQVSSEAELAAFAATPPGSMYDLVDLLSKALYVCGGGTGRRCGAGVGASSLSWVKIAFITIGAIVALTAFCTIAYVRMKPQWHELERRIGRCLPAAWQKETKVAGDSSSSGDDDY